MPKFYVTFFLLFALPAFPIQAETLYEMSEPLSVMPLKLIDKLVFVEATVNGKSGYFLFDTGIGALTLNERYFGEDEEVGVIAKVTDVNGRRERAMGAHVDSFCWGGLQRDDFYVPLLDLEGLEEILDIRLLGLLGQEVYKDLEVHINFDEKVVSLMELDEEGYPVDVPYTEAPRHVVSFEMEGYLPVISARVGELALRMGWDSGASINMFNKKLRKHLPDHARKLMRINYGGAFSSRRAPFIAVDAIHVDEQFSVIAWRMAATRMKHFLKKDIDIDGLIGADLLRLGSISINYQRREISVWINDNIFSQRYETMKKLTPPGLKPILASPE